jgi:hypothetical protein
MVHPVRLTKEEARQLLFALADVFFDMGFGGDSILQMIQKVLDDWAKTSRAFWVKDWERDAEIYGNEFKALGREIRKHVRI